VTGRLTVLHTSDWHLGHTLHGHSREAEHADFLEHLLAILEEEEVDALLLTGDVYETSNPPASAQAQYFGFLAEAKRRCPELDVVVLGGNHDSAARLGASAPLLEPLGVRVVAQVPRLGEGGRAPVDAEAMVLPLHAGGEVAAWVAAVPFLRVGDLPPGVDYAEGVRAVYGTVLDAARGRREAGQALLATGHLHLVSGAASMESERRLRGDAVAEDLFDEDIAYVALGHLHRPQAVGRESIRYAGSPIPLSMPEHDYPHQVRLAVFEGEALVEQQAIRVPRTVGMHRIPADGPGELEDVLAELAAARFPVLEEAEAPFLEVRVVLREPQADLRQRVEEAIAPSGEAAVRLVRIATTYVGEGAPLADAVSSDGGRTLSDLAPEEVFRQCFARRYEGAPSPALLSAFREVLEAARSEGDEVPTAAAEDRTAEAPPRMAEASP
jgi:exonuclease SbcD